MTDSAKDRDRVTYLIADHDAVELRGRRWHLLRNRTKHCEIDGWKSRRLSIPDSGQDASAALAELLALDQKSKP